MDARDPVLQFIDALPRQESRKIFQIFHLLDAKKGLYANEEKFTFLRKSHGYQLYEIKSYQVRIGCFWGAQHTLYLAHAFKKKDRRWRKADLDRLDAACASFTSP